jgi:hypothetical protein
MSTDFTIIVEKLREKLAFYDNLNRIGNVYLEYIPDKYSTLVDLLIMAEPDQKDFIQRMLKFGFTLNSTHQTRNLKKYNKHRKYLQLSHHIASIYKNEHGGACAVRVKNKVHKSEILEGKTGMKNVYPNTYIKQIREFLKRYPLKNWNKNNLDDSFTYHKELKLYECMICENKVNKNQRNKHLKKCELMLENELVCSSTK